VNRAESSCCQRIVSTNAIGSQSLCTVISTEAICMERHGIASAPPAGIARGDFFSGDSVRFRFFWSIWSCNSGSSGRDGQEAMQISSVGRGDDITLIN